MSNGSFHISYENPNDRHGGGGCVCSEMQPATRGPRFIVFDGLDTESPISPRTVLCSQCVPLIQERLDAKDKDENVLTNELIVLKDEDVVDETDDEVIL